MEESYGEGLATHTGPESCAVGREVGGEALTGVRAGWLLSSENTACGAPTHLGLCGRQHLLRRSRLTEWGPAESKNPGMYGTILRENWEVSCSPAEPWHRGAHREVCGRTPMVDEQEKSDRPVVLTKPANKAGRLGAELAEGRGLAEGNWSRATGRTPDAVPEMVRFSVGAGTRGLRRWGRRCQGAFRGRSSDLRQE